MENLLSYILESHYLVAPALYVLGVVMKRSKKVKDEYIPAILLAVGITVAVLITLSTADLSNWQTGLGDIITGVLQGALVTGVAVLGKQLYIQRKKAKQSKEEKTDA